MVHDFGGGGALVARGDGRVQDYASDEFLQPRIANGAGVFKKIGEVDFLGFGEAKVLERKLGLVAINFDARLDLDEIVAADVFHREFKLIPHASFDGAAAVAKFKTQVLLAFAGAANLFFVNEKKSSDVLLGIEIGNERRLHVPDCAPGRLPNNRN